MEGIMESDREFDRLFGMFGELVPSMAAEWKACVDASGIEEEVRRLASAYALQNGEIHSACLRCRPDVDCPLSRREEDWIGSGGPDMFHFDACGLFARVSPEAWGAFSFLLVASEHAHTLVFTLGHIPEVSELWNEPCAEWHVRLAARFNEVRPVG
jgi:hypothetical protein